MQWEGLLSEFGKEAVRLAGDDASWLPVAYNPITRALRERPAESHVRVGKRTTDVMGGYLGQLWDIKGFSMTALSRAATICQMSVYDDRGGPDGDGEPKGLRRSWYSFYKVDFAQPFSRQLGEPAFNGIGWNGRQSQTYSYLVDKKNVTYQDLWVKDSSRMMREFYTPLYRGANFVFCVEKDSLFEDFEAAAGAMGCRVLLSGKGKMSKAGTEKMLREYFHYDGHELFDYDRPLVMIALSDHDFDGESVIDPTFAAQAERYTYYVKRARIGIRPYDVPMEEWPVKWFDLKTDNKGYAKWALDEGLYMARCATCGNEWAVYRGANVTAGALHECPQCGQATSVVLSDETSKTGLRFIQDPHGFEVEAMPTRSYYPLAVSALLDVVPFEDIVDRLRDECTAQEYDAASAVMQDVLADNEDYQALLAEFDRLNAIKNRFESDSLNRLRHLAIPHIDEWRDLESDPEPADFKGYVAEARRGASPWRPFSRELRTERLVNRVKGAGQGVVSELKEQEIDWQNQELGNE